MTSVTTKGMRAPVRAAWLGAFAITQASLPALAHDEHVYFTAQGGTSTAKFTAIRDFVGSFESGTTATDLSLDRTGLYGAKMGMYSRSGVLGIEGEVFQTRPDVKVQQQTSFEPTFGPSTATSGGSQKVTTWAINLVGRVPITQQIIAQAGIGPALFKSKLHLNRELAQSSSEAGLNTQLGLSYFVTKSVVVSAEWKHNSARFNFGKPGGTTDGFQTDYKADHIVLGVSYAFDWAAPFRAPVTVRGLLGLPPGRIGPDN